MITKDPISYKNTANAGDPLQLIVVRLTQKGRNYEEKNL